MLEAERYKDTKRKSAFEIVMKKVLEKGGYFSDKISVNVNSDCGRCIVTKEDIKKGEIFTKIPFEFDFSILSKDLDEATKDIPQDGLSQEFKVISLMSYFLFVEKRKEDSFYKVLAETYSPLDKDHYLFFYPEEKIKLLEGSELYDHYMKYSSQFENNYKLLKDNLEEHNISYDEFKEIQIYILKNQFIERNS